MKLCLRFSRSGIQTGALGSGVCVLNMCPWLCIKSFLWREEAGNMWEEARGEVGRVLWTPGPPSFSSSFKETTQLFIVTRAAAVSGPPCPRNHPSQLPLSPPPGRLIDRNRDTRGQQTQWPHTVSFCVGHWLTRSAQQTHPTARAVPGKLGEGWGQCFVLVSSLSQARAGLGDWRGNIGGGRVGVAEKAWRVEEGVETLLGHLRRLLQTAAK